MKRTDRRVINYLILSFTMLTTIFPYLWMLLSALKSKKEIFSGTLFPAGFQFSNFSRVLFQTPILSQMLNSIYVSAFIVIIQITGAILAAYVFARIDKKWVRACFLLIMAIYMLPAAATYVPSYILISNAGLMDTHLGYILSESISIFSLFFLRQTFKQVPDDIVNAAKIDGVGHLGLIAYVYIPFCKTAIASLVVINSIYSYNNYMWPSLLIKSPDKMLITVGLRQLFIQQAGYGTDWPVAMAACTISILPLLLLLVIGNKKILQSMSGLYLNK